MNEWWRDPRCHFGTLKITDPVLIDRASLADAIRFILEQLELENGARVLDLCCGPGKYLVELSRSGLDVVGIDINEDYVALAQQLVEQEGARAEVCVGDMREIPYANHFDAVINLGTSFGFFETETEDEAALEAVASALKPGGRFLLEMGNRDYLLKNFETTTSIQNPDGTITKVERSFDYMRSRINTRFQKFENGEPSDNWSHSWRAYTLAELTRLLDHAKLEFVSTFGSWRSETYDVNTSRMLVISKRRAA